MLESMENVVALARDDLALYAVAQWPRFQLAKHHATLADKLEAAARGEISRLMVFMPPRHGKSMISTRFFPGWYLGKFPSRSVITASYSQDIADDFGRKVRNDVSNDVHRTIFPGFRITVDSKSLRRFETGQGGEYFAVGRGGPITGRGAHVVLIDDPLKDRAEARSETIRRSLHEWFENVLYTRLAPGGIVILIQTRWHDDDLAGWLLREHAEQDWQVLSLPAIAERDESFRKAGEALWPERFSLRTLLKTKESVGSSAWSSLYQQRPVSAETAVFKQEWFRRYRELPASFQKIVQSWDTAFKVGADNDYSVCTTWGVTENAYFLISLWRGRVEFPELRRQVVNQGEAWKPHEILVEDRASGQSIVQEIRQATRFPVVPVKVDSDKRTRAEAVTPLFEAGKVLLPEDAAWLPDFEDELVNFPVGVHDDCVDSVSMALNHLRGSSNWANTWMVQMAREAKQNQQPQDAAQELGQAQKLEATKTMSIPRIFGEARGSGYQTKTIEGEITKNQPRLKLKACPLCDNAALGRCGDFSYCRCGWNSKQLPAPNSQSTVA
jgi:predicted phage terminase large subunit-like protein